MNVRLPRSLLFAVVALTAHGLVACASNKSAEGSVDYASMGPSMTAKRYANLKKMASKDLGCPADSLQHEYTGENMHVMRGCNTEGSYELRCAMGSCVWIPDVRARAEFDLNCPRVQIRVTNLDASTRGASGCGKRATYKMSPVDGSWIMNSIVIFDEAPPAPVPQPKVENTEI